MARLITELREKKSEVMLPLNFCFHWSVPQLPGTSAGSGPRLLFLLLVCMIDINPLSVVCFNGQY